MQAFRTEVHIPEWGAKVDHSTRFFVLGSCFATHIGHYLQRNKFNVGCNPFGVLYNPLSIYRALGLLIDNRPYTATDLEHSNGVWFAYTHHGNFSSTDQEECLHKINTSLNEGAAQLHSADVLIITLGTAWVYYLKETGMVVANCHKTPAKAFDRRMLTVDDVALALHKMLELLKKIRPSLRVVFTVSPIRHWKDGAHGNQLSKATLMLGVDQVLAKPPLETLYFPAYEILMDELRDYRFYADDMCHPSDLAIRYILDRFCQVAISTEAQAVMTEIEHLGNAIRHRPFNPEAKEYRIFVDKELQRFLRLQKLLPQANWKEELHFFGL